MKWYERLKIIREARGLKKVHFAKLVGVAPATITEWERGDTENPSATNTLKICEVLMISPGHLMNGDDLPRIGFQYEGKNAQIARAVELLELIPEAGLSHVLAIIETFSTKQNNLEN